MFKKKISVIIPCFNEEKVIRATYKRLYEVFKINSLDNYEFIFINDGSFDNTYSTLLEISAENDCVKILDFSRNFGHQAAVTAGLKSCSGDIAIIIDADLQDPPELIPSMIVMYENNNCNVVYGVRTARKGDSFFKKFTAKLYYRTINYLSDVNLPKDTGDFRLIDRKVIDKFNELPEKNKYIRGLIAWVGFKQIPIYYTRDPRFDGVTKYPLKKMIRFASTGLIYFSKKPLSLAIKLGFLSIIIGLFFSTISLYLKIFHPESIIPGWTSTMIVFVFFGGVQLVSVGIIGFYIGSIFDEVKNRPEYIIANKINFNE